MLAIGSRLRCRWPADAVLLRARTRPRRLHVGIGRRVWTTAAAPRADYQPASDFIRPSYCPPVMIRGGTAALAVYDKGHDNDAAFLRYQASIATTARQCTVGGTTLTAKVGVAGRVVGGPKAAAGTVTVPIRVVVVKQVGGTGPSIRSSSRCRSSSAPGFRVELRPGL